MAGEDKQQIGLSVLKGLNAAVTTTKLYPPHFPQVADAVEKAFELITEYLSKHGTLSFSMTDNEPKLCGLPVSQKTLGKVHGEDIFRQLNLLHLDHVVLENECLRPTFNALMTFFTTSPQLVNREGGGRAFVVNLGLNDNFPEEYTAEVPTEREDSFVNVLSELKKEGKVAGEDIQILINEIDGETIGGQKKISVLADHATNQESMVTLIIAGTSQLLQGIKRSGEIFFPFSFATLLRNVNRVVNEEDRETLAQATALACREMFNDFGMCVVLLQHFPKGFGMELYDRLLAATAKDFESIVHLMREEQASIAKTVGKTAEQYGYIRTGIERFFATERGQQFLMRENAKSALDAGEKERQAKRIQAGIHSILKGDVKSLRNKEIVNSLPATIESLIGKGKDKAAATIITNITTELLKDDERSHDLLGECLGSVAEGLVNSEKWEWLEKVSIPLMAWLKGVDRADDVFENVVEILIKLQNHYWQTGKDHQADTILKLIFAIRSGKLEKSQEVVAIVTRLQDKAVERTPLSEILAKSVEGSDEFADRRLILQGPLVTRFLLNKLLDSENREERLKILELLRRKKSMLPPVLLEKLASPMPWYGKRNLLKLLAETGSSKHARKIIEYLNHEDIRVQQEAFLCIDTLSGEDKKDNLLDALSFASGPMMEQVVRALTPVADEEVIGVVADLLADWKHFPDEIRDPLLEQSVKLLGKTTSSTAEKVLDDFLQLENKSRARIIGDAVWQAARQAYRKIRTARREISKKQAQTAPRESRPPAFSPKQPGTTTTRRTEYPEEADIAELFENNETEEGKKRLVELIGKAARASRFEEAKKLREWLVEVEPAALSEIIQAAEIIEEAQREGISNDYLKIWSRLHDNLTSEEFNAVYYAMEHASYSSEHELVRQGEVFPALFFVNQGKVKLYFHDKNEGEVLLRVVEQGEIFGGDTFFDASVWTTSAATLSHAEISSLSYEQTREWSANQPALMSKLLDFVRQHHQEKTAEQTKTSRREHPRQQIQGVVQFDSADEQSGTYGTKLKGELANICSGGLSCVVRISKKKNARILLGRTMTLQLPSADSAENRMNIDGDLVAIRSLYNVENEYSAHLKFSRLLTEEELHSVHEACKKTAE
ncbi:MAG: cyclic nucleotide-binding domain-containing protein [Desulfocapsaceae bacterium]|nr:cyclic nucleotide-binding domain-containing protein [Desulfocapsaceae bacterium]